MDPAITRQTTVVQALSRYPLARELLKKHGIQFVGKDLSPLEPLEKVARGNGLSDQQVDALVNDLNAGMARAQQQLLSGELVILTPAAAGAFHALLTRHRGKKGIRLRLSSDGCALYSYDLDFGTRRLSGEEEVRTQGITLWVEKKSLGLLKGVTIDYQGDGFLFRNPHVRGES